MAVDLAPELLEILACPNCHGALAVDHDRDELVCVAADCGLAYPGPFGYPGAPDRRGPTPHESRTRRHLARTLRH